MDPVAIIRVLIPRVLLLSTLRTAIVSKNIHYNSLDFYT